MNILKFFLERIADCQHYEHDHMAFKLAQVKVLVERLQSAESELSTLRAELDNAALQIKFRDGLIQSKDEYIALMEAELDKLKQQKPVGYADPQAFENFKNEACSKEWMWAKHDNGLTGIYAHPVPPQHAPDAPTSNEALLNLGKRLTELLDEDQWNNIEPQLLAISAQLSPPKIKVTAQGVSFGNAWFSHEKITGYDAERLNSGHCDIAGREYMKWVRALLSPTPPSDEAK